MPGQEPTPDRPPVDLEALTDLRTPWCILVVATLRIADHVAAGTSDIGQLAGATGCDARALHNVLGHLVAKGIFEETAPGRFALNDPALQLREASDFLDLEGIGGRMGHAWSTLPTYVRTGAPGYAEVFGLPFWEDLAAHPKVAASFDALMGPAGHGTPDAEIPISGGWEPVRTVVDVGGGTGAMLAEVLRAHPGTRGTLVDFPGTVARSSKVFEGAGVADRVTRSVRASSTRCRRARRRVPPNLTRGPAPRPASRGTALEIGDRSCYKQPISSTGPRRERAMAVKDPVAEQNLDGYGAPLIPWAKVRARLEEGLTQAPETGGPARHTCWLATVRPDGRPHVMPLGVLFVDGKFYFNAGPGTRKARNLAANPQCVITVATHPFDLVVEGEAVKVTDEATLQRIAEAYAAEGWEPTVRGGALYAEFSAPAAGPPPWDVYEMTPATLFALGTAEPYGATRWRFQT